ncbi:metal ABC transporter permease [bacterium]|nr:metal ABC transporter permease [candidate division CSSED10-310 bacterium]
MIEALTFEFMRNAVAAGILAAVACGILGTLVVVNRIVFISGGIAHAAYGGVGLAFFLGLAPLLGIAFFSLAAALVMAVVSLRARERADTIIGVIWAVGMALGIVLLDLTPGYNVDLMSYLFGSILTVPRTDLLLMLGVDLMIIASMALFYKEFVAISYDAEFARIRGVPVRALYLLLMVLIALSVVMVIQTVGLILVIALLTISPFMAEKFSASLAAMMAWSTLFNLVFTLAGLTLAYTFNLTSGAAIILTAGAGFFIFLIGERVHGHFQGRRTGAPA